MAVEGYDYDRDAVAPPDTWGSTAKDVGLKFVGSGARTVGELGQAVGAKEFAHGAREVERAAESQMSPLGKEVEKSSFIPGMAEHSSWAHPVRSALSGAVDLATSSIPYVAGATVGSVGGPVGAVAGGMAAGGAQGWAAAEYNARKRVEEMTPEQKHTLPVWRDVLANRGTEEQADEALVAALTPLTAKILSTAGGALPGAGMGHMVGGALGRGATERITMGIAPKLLPTMGATALAEGTALGGGSALSETGRQTGEINAGAQEGYDPLAITKAGVSGGTMGMLFGGAGGYKSGRAGAIKAREQLEKMREDATQMNAGLDWEKANPLVPPGATPAGPPPAGTGAGTVNKPPTTAQLNPGVANAGATLPGTTLPGTTLPGTPAAAPVAPAQQAALKTAAATTGQPTGSAAAHPASTANLAGGAHAAHENVIDTIVDTVNAKAAQTPPVTPPVDPTAGAVPPVDPTVAPPVTPPVTPPVAPPVASKPVAAKPVESWPEFAQRMEDATRAGMPHTQYQQEFNTWKGIPQPEGAPPHAYIALQDKLGEIRSVMKVEAAKVKAQAKADAEAQKLQAAQDAAKAKAAAEAKVEAAPVEAAPEIKALEVAPEVTPVVTEPAKEPVKPEAGAKPVEPVAPKAGERGVDKVGKEFTWVEREVAGQKVLAKSYDAATKDTSTATRTKEQDAAKTETKIADRVEKAVAESAPLVDHQRRAEEEHARLTEEDRTKRAADRAAGKPVRFASIPKVEDIRARLEREHTEAVRTAEIAKDQAEKLKDAAAARGVRKGETEATEENARTAALALVEEQSSHHEAHGAEEAAAASGVSSAERNTARSNVAERARAMVKSIEDALGSKVTGKAAWGKEGVKQNLLNALRDTKDMLRRWDKRNDDKVPLKTRQANAAKLNRDFVDHIETMFYLRDKTKLDELGTRREARSKERTAQEREKGGEKQAGETKATGATEHEELADATDFGKGEHEGEQTGRAKEEGEADFGEHGFTEIDTAGLMPSGSRAGAAGPRTTTFKGDTISNDPTYQPDNLIGKRLRYKVVKRWAGHRAMKFAYDAWRSMFEDRHVISDQPELAGAHAKHMMEWTSRMRTALAHVKTEVISAKDWDELINHVFQQPGHEVHGIFVPDERANRSISDGRIILPEWALEDEHSLAQVLTHEYGHAATSKALRRDYTYRFAMQELFDAFKAATDVDPSHYALHSLGEFVTEAHVSAETFSSMAKLEAPADVVAYVQGLPKPTVKMNMAQAFVGMLARWLGFKRPSMSMLDAYVRMNEHILSKGREITDSRSTVRTDAARQGRINPDRYGDPDHYSDPDSRPEIMAMRMPTMQGVRKGLINQAARMKVQGGTFADRWKATMMNVKTTMQIAQGMDYLFGKLEASHSPLAKRALDLLPDNLRTAMEGKSLSRVFSDLQQRQNARLEELLGTTGGKELTNRAYDRQKVHSVDGSSPTGDGTMWDYFTKLVHDETAAGANWGGEANDHLDPAKLSDAQALASIPAGEARWRALPDDLKQLRTDGHEYFRRQQKAMSDFLSDNTVDELTDKIRNTENLKAVKAPIFDKAGIEDFKKWLRDKRPDTHPHNDLYKDILNTGPEGRRLKEIRALAEVAGPYLPLMRRGDFHVTGYHELADMVGQTRRLDKAGETYDPADPAHVERAHEFNTYEFPDEATARPAIEAAHMKAQQTGEKLVNKTTQKVETVVRPKKVGASEWETNYGGSLQKHTSKAAADAARDAYIAANYDKRIHTTLQNKHVEFHENATDHEIARRELESTPGFTITEAGARPYEPQHGTEDMAGSVHSMRRAMEKSSTYQSLPGPDKRVMQDVLSQHALRILGSTRIQSHRLPRQNVLGASHDLAHNFADYAHSSSGYIARLEYGPHIHRVADAMKGDVKSMGADSNAFLRTHAMNQFEARRDQVGAPDDTFIGKSVNRLLQLSFLKRLASPAFHVVNAQDPWMRGIPTLSIEHGVGRSAAMVAKVYRAIGGLDILGQGFLQTGRAFRSKEGMDFGGRIRDRLTGDDQRAIDDLRQRGAIGRDAGMEFKTLDVANASLVGRAMDRADHIARQMGQAIESINRSVIGLSAYRLMREKLGSDPKAHEKAVEYAAEMIDNTAGTYDRWNAPPVFNTQLGRMMLQFHKFGQSQYYLMGKMIGASLKGDNKLDNAKGFGLLLGTHFIMAGALGLPTEPITMAVNVANTFGLTDATSDTLTNSFRETVAAHFGKEVGQFLTTGAPAYFGVDLSNRLSLGQLLGPFGAPKSHKVDDIFNYYAKWMAGSAPGMVTEYLSGLGDLAAGNYGDAATKLSPMKVASDSAKGLVNVIRAKTNPSGRKAGEQYTIGEGITQGLGFAPSRIAEAARAKNVIYSGNQNYSKTRTGLSGDYLKATTADERTDAWDAIQRFNAQQTTGKAKIQMSELLKQRRGAARAEQDAKSAGLPTGARINKRAPEIAQRARDTYNY